MSRRGLWLFVTLGVAWGIPYLLIKIAVTELSPAELVLARTTLAALLLLPIAALRGAIGPALRRWKPVAAFTLVEIAIPWLFLNRAETRLPSSTTGLLIAAVPLVGLLVAFLMGRAERLGRVGWLGLGFGFAGVAALVGLDVGGSDLVAVAELGVVVVGYAVGPAILARWLDDTPAIGVIAVALTATALIYLPIVAFTGGLPTQLPSRSVVLSVLLLAVVCTALAFLVLFALVGEIGPVRATTITYVNPAVAVVAGVLVLNEPVTVWTVLGFALVVTGSVLVNRRPSARSAPPVPPSPAVPAQVYSVER
ncbi:MAG TPA: DMT family transporter [Actinomycetes bacterium]|nr:DMT family transporter [Actinomycetes bacterium]